MLAWIIGPPDYALVALGIVIVFGVIMTALIVNRRSTTEVSNEFELNKMKLQLENNRELVRLRDSRDYQFKQLDQNLITSHAEVNTGGDKV